VFVSDCAISKNTNGIVLNPSGAGAATAVLKRVVIDGNTSIGVRTVKVNATMFLDDTVITGNQVGISSLQSSSMVSFGNNAVMNNVANGSPTSTIPKL
jgi:aspartate aminotransferase-like enzyme